MRLDTIGSSAFLLLALAACNDLVAAPPPAALLAATETPGITAASIPSPPATTPSPSATLPSMAPTTVAAPPSRTPTQVARAGSSPEPITCDVLPSGNFNSLWQSDPNLQTLLGCPSSHHPRIPPDAWAVKTSYQPFEHGAMLWSSQLGWYTQPTIYVVYADSTYQQFEDHSTPAADATGGAPQAPRGFVEPVMGFGQVWHGQQTVRQALGWATAPEIPGTGRFEMYLYGDMVWTSQTNKTYVFDPGSKQVRVFDVSF